MQGQKKSRIFLLPFARRKQKWQPPAAAMTRLVPHRRHCGCALSARATRAALLWPSTWRRRSLWHPVMKPSEQKRNIGTCAPGAPACEKASRTRRRCRRWERSRVFPSRTRTWKNTGPRTSKARRHTCSSSQEMSARPTTSA
ncbi:unnamed protein product [Amoebophrya sp. A120]|nr:unnamed protein product [Amoebophrya sp. A120]|eukprot:GSA120T00017717001.1